MKIGSEGGGKGKLMAELVSKAKFESFFRGFKDKKVRGGDSSWANEISLHGAKFKDATGDRLAERFGGSLVKRAQLLSILCEFGGARLAFYGL